MERFNEIPEAYLNEISGTTKVASVLKALHDLLENEEIPTEIRKLSTKTAYKLVTITEGKISENAKIRDRDYFGRKKRS